MRQTWRSALPLTPRQLEILAYVASGLELDEIARELQISRHTVKDHLSNAIRALEARNRSHAVALAVKLGLI